MGAYRLGSALLAATCLSTGAWAQSATDVSPVTPANSPIGAPVERERAIEPTSLDPIGAHFGAFTFYPKLDTAVTYDDNIYALQNKTDDVVFRVSPSFKIDGDARPYKLNFYGGVDRLLYAKNSDENRTDWRFGSRDSLEFLPETTLALNAGYAKNHEDRGDPNSNQTAIKPTVYYRTDAGFELARNVGQLRAGLRGTYAYTNYNDSPQLGGGITNNDDRDRKNYFTEGKLGYEFSTGYFVIAKVAYDSVVYNDRFDDGGFDRRSTGLRGSVGVAFELTQVLTGEATVGYLERRYRDLRFNDLKRFAYNAQIEWFPSELTSLRFTINNAPQETVSGGYRGFIANTFQVRVEHELMRTVKLTGTVRYIENSYLRDDITTVPAKTEKYYGLSAGVKYILNRNLSTVLGYDYNKKTSTATGRGAEFVRNKASLSVVLQL